MPSNLFNSIGKNQQLPPPFNNLQNTAAQFNQFKNSFQGDPKQQVQQLLNSGRMSQSQFNQLKNIADRFQQYFR